MHPHRLWPSGRWLAALTLAWSLPAAPAFAGEAGTLPLLGQIEPRPARDISGSLISVGAETMDRGYTVYRNWREHLGALGAKHARIQSGWAKTEPKKGVYDWAWLDEIIPDMAGQGVKPWICLCYGNPVYEGGGNASSSSPLPKGDALKAWENFVAALVQRFGKFVDEWEVWNEPQHQKITVSDYAAFVIRTAQTVRGQQPAARLFAVAAAGVGVRETTGLLEILRQEGKLGLVNAVTFHPYAMVPESTYSQAEGLRKAVQGFSKEIIIYQGENGCPSTKSTYGALSGGNWTELSQAKWALRRMLGDLGRNLPTSYFSIADMHYAKGDKPGAPLALNTKGLIETNPDQTFKRLKPAYRAVQHLTAIFDDRLTLDPSAKAAISGEKLSQQGFVWTRVHDQARVASLWEVRGAPTNDPALTPRKIVLRGCTFARPVWVDLLSGEVRAVPEALVSRAVEGQLVLTEIPVFDSPVLIAERDAIPLREPKR
jgi:hypothetical protein